MVTLREIILMLGVFKSIRLYQYTQSNNIIYYYNNGMSKYVSLLFVLVIRYRIIRFILSKYSFGLGFWVG